ncbi:DUF6093 family protein [Kribbella sp. CA-293567]|uniref:DUF6093 family protein n=1 Tax=Kribbella sp. CA-293567 TaxID=3002436 RepID=UPI0022DD4CE6|nr:DUF6093 family protein [Kribbella sp. CA-293567]WBQ03019.1 DUF6093 family protein [Kribbella sp. CA-293567]
MSVLTRGRRAARRRMRDSCRLNQPDVKGPLDEATGQYTPVAGPLKYAGACKVQLRVSATGSDPVAGDRAFTVLRYELHLSMSAPAAVIDDVVTITAAASDPELVGRRFRVAALVHKTDLTARRLIVEEVQS